MADTYYLYTDETPTRYSKVVSTNTFTTTDSEKHVYTNHNDAVVDLNTLQSDSQNDTFTIHIGTTPHPH